MSAPRLFLGVDCGGTGIAAGLVREDGTVLDCAVEPTQPAAGAPPASERLATVVAAWLARAGAAGEHVAGIGVGVPGAVDPASGTVGPDVYNLPGLAGEPLRGVLADRFGLPVALDNDVNALALGEFRFGAGWGARCLVLLAVGTGVGGGVVLGGRLLRGAVGYAGEVGHTVIAMDGRSCICGRRGCLKAYVAGPDIAAQAREAAAAGEAASLVALVGGDPAALTAEVLFAAARAGDGAAAALVGRVARALGVGIGNLLNTFNPDRLLLAGGVMQAADLLLPPALAEAERVAYPSAFRTATIGLASIEKAAGVRGAAALCLEGRGTRGTAMGVAVS